MKGFLKFLLIGALVVAVVVVVAVVFVGANLNKIVKTAVEKVGTEVTGTSVGLEGAEFSLREGSGALRGLSIANPAGFSEGNAFKLDNVSLDLDVSSVTSDEIVLDSIVIDGAFVSFEEKGGKTNLQQLLENIQSQAGEKEEKTEDGKEPPKIVIKEFRFTNAQAALSSEKLGQETTVSIPDIVLSDIGTPGAGLTPAEAGKAIMKPVISNVLKGAQEQILEKIKTDGVKGLLKGLGGGDSEGDGGGIGGLLKGLTGGRSSDEAATEEATP